MYFLRKAQEIQGNVNSGKISPICVVEIGPEASSLCNRKCDTKILVITSRAIVALPALHTSCYRDYTRPAPGLDAEPAPYQENNNFLEK